MTDAKKAELVISTELNIDKADIADIAIAEAETTIKKRIKYFGTQATKLKSEAEKGIKTITDIGEALVLSKFKTKMARIQKGLITTGVKELSLDLDISINSNFNPGSDFAIDEVNCYSLAVFMNTSKTKKYNAQSQAAIVLEKGAFSATKQQLSLAKQSRTANENHRSVNLQILEYRKKLGDMPSLERQVRGQLAKNELEKNPDGHKIVKAVLSSLDDNVKLLGL